MFVCIYIDTCVQIFIQVHKPIHIYICWCICIQYLLVLHVVVTFWSNFCFLFYRQWCWICNSHRQPNVSSKLSPQLGVYIYTHLCIYKYMYVYVRMKIHMNIYVYIYIYWYVHIHILYEHVWIYLYIQICVHVYKYISIYVCIYIYIHIYVYA